MNIFVLANLLSNHQELVRDNTWQNQPIEVQQLKGHTVFKLKQVAINHTNTHKD